MKNLALSIGCLMVVITLWSCAPYHQENAQNAVAQGRLDDAASEIQAAVAADPSNLLLKHMAAEILTKRGVKSYQDGQMLAARADFQSALNYDGNYAPAWDYLGLIAFSENDWSNAISYGQKAAGLSVQPDPTYVQQAEDQLRKVRSGGIRPYIGSGRRHRRPNYNDSF